MSVARYVRNKFPYASRCPYSGCPHYNIKCTIQTTVLSSQKNRRYSIIKPPRCSICLYITRKVPRHIVRTNAHHIWSWHFILYGNCLGLKLKVTLYVVASILRFYQCGGECTSSGKRTSACPSQIVWWTQIPLIQFSNLPLKYLIILCAWCSYRHTAYEIELSINQVCYMPIVTIKGQVHNCPGGLSLHCIP